MTSLCFAPATGKIFFVSAGAPWFFEVPRQKTAWLTKDFTQSLSIPIHPGGSVCRFLLSLFSRAHKLFYLALHPY
jgi:hypothetical protein